MISRAWRVGLLALWSAAAAASPLPSPNKDSSDSTPEFVNHGKILTRPIEEPVYDVLWEKYGLNKSQEYKYFHEPGQDDTLGHYDTRFFTEPVPDEERSETLTHMIRAYLNFFNEKKLETWIAHGTLLGWWWNGKNLPWDWDIDTQVPDTTLLQLADDFNQTIFHYTAADSNAERKYLLDINPWARQRERGQGLNIIDARWIDMRTGLYIDITGLSRLEKDKPHQWQDKNNHKYQTGDIYPLRKTVFEGMPAKIPFQYDAILIEEYSQKALTTSNFHNHTWYPDLQEWVSDDDDEFTTKKDLEDDRQYERR
ncbi:putative mannosylphosphate transferase (Mnn4) [Aspergillus clavatus NRRL 1]|uniref:Mannosylphosphate transferase (Mnn4), putative n=1 Tax=Aspergillus clavatus (strain ATCC 1007 / CBS 513.65 / DSM 816 / NCTC 3887 / NRRL 1 / QM 1276 / 107) TaxID=344612 RepID=A1CPJ8_ASPCL|nr:mannosylphosphate transferase (Mnn4), putative [Aspergillus clavatus NRRL 1]EAW07569.1 mannosylphosphate transferase (Mnn4), putative [Aspergillus clavatus NRRL 1]